MVVARLVVDASGVFFFASGFCFVSGFGGGTVVVSWADNGTAITSDAAASSVFIMQAMGFMVGKTSKANACSPVRKPHHPRPQKVYADFAPAVTSGRARRFTAFAAFCVAAQL